MGHETSSSGACRICCVLQVPYLSPTVNIVLAGLWFVLLDVTAILLAMQVTIAEQADRAAYSAFMTQVQALGCKHVHGRTRGAAAHGCDACWPLLPLSTPGDAPVDPAPKSGMCSDLGGWGATGAG